MLVFRVRSFKTNFLREVCMKSQFRFLLLSIPFILGLVLGNCSFVKDLDPTNTLGDDSDDVNVSGSFSEDTMNTALPALLSAALPASSSYLKAKYTAEDVAKKVLVVCLAMECLLDALNTSSAEDLVACLGTAKLEADGTYKLNMQAKEQRLCVIWDKDNQINLAYMNEGGTAESYDVGSKVKKVTECTSSGACKTVTTVEKGKALSTLATDTITVLLSGTYKMTFNKINIKGDDSLLKNKFKSPSFKRIAKLQSPPPPNNGGGQQGPPPGKGEEHGGPQPGEKIDLLLQYEVMSQADLKALFSAYPEFGIEDADIKETHVGAMCALPEGDSEVACAPYELYETSAGKVFHWVLHEEYSFSRGCMALNSETGCTEVSDMTIDIQDPSEPKAAVKVKIIEKRQFICDDSGAKDAIGDQFGEEEQAVEMYATMKLKEESDYENVSDFIENATGAADNSIEITAKIIPQQTLFTHGNCDSNNPEGYNEEAVTNMITFLCQRGSEANEILKALKNEGSADMDIEFGTADGEGFFKACGLEVTDLDFVDDPIYDMNDIIYLCDSDKVEDPADCSSDKTLYALEVECHARSGARSDSKEEGECFFRLIEGGCQDWGKLKSQGPGGPPRNFDEPCTTELIAASNYGMFLQGGQDFVDAQYLGLQNCYFIPQDNLKPNPPCDSNYKDGVHLCYEVNNDGTAHVEIRNSNESAILFETDEASMFFNEITWDVEVGDDIYAGTIGFGVAQCGYYPGDQIDLVVSLNDASCLISANISNCGFGQPQGGENNATLLIVDDVFDSTDSEISFYYDQTCSSDDLKKVLGEHFDKNTCSCYWDPATYTEKCSDTCPKYSFDILSAQEGADENLYVSLISSLETSPIVNNLKISIPFYDNQGFEVFYNDPNTSTKLDHEYRFKKWGEGASNHNYEGSIRYNNYSNSNAYCYIEVRFHNPQYQ